jgi:hypothetical protein
VFTEPLCSNDKKIPSSEQFSELLLVLASIAILGSEFHGIHDHILLLQTNAPAVHTKTVETQVKPTGSLDKIRAAKNVTHPTILLFLFVFVATGKPLPSRFLATIRAYKYRHADLWEVFMNHAARLGSGVMLYIP